MVYFGTHRLSVYAYIIETKFEADDKYEPMCDIHERISCTKAFASEYGKGFGLIPEDSIFYKPNSLYGIVHYCVTIALSMINTKFVTKLLLFLVVLSNLSSIYFAYILYFILYDLCVVCVSIYAVNALMFKYSYSKFRIIVRNKNKVE
ncbi:Vitamin-K epoxide reductase [Carabus blaptoides fortunei]